MTILHDRIDCVARVGPGARGPLRHEATVRVGQRAMRGVAPLLSTEVHGAIPAVRGPVWLGPILRPQPALVLLWGQRHLDRDEALVAGFGPDQRAVRAHVPAHQPFGYRALDRLVEQPLEDSRLVEAAAPILTEGRGIPRLLVEVQPREPAQGHIALQLRHQLPVAGHPQQVAAHEGEEQLLRWNRRPPQKRVEIPTRAADSPVVDERADLPQRMVGGDERLQLDVVEERPLRIRLSHHRWAPPLLHTTPTRGRRIQENPLELPLSAAC